MAMFKTIVHAKCVLAGEHAVLRGHPAIVAPLFSKSLELTFKNGDKLEADCEHSEYSDVLLTVFWGALERCMQMLKKDYKDIHGKFVLTNNIPMGNGLGFSSSLSAALAQWAVWNGMIEQYQLFDFARSLEDHFHGKSSGIDIIGALSHQCTLYQLQKSALPLNMQWQPNLYVSSSEHHSETATCINHVNELWHKDVDKAKAIDSKMAYSVTLIGDALSKSADEGLICLSNGINSARECFESWGLVNEKLATHMQLLKHHGALAVKPTGSGSGGYILSLWKNKPTVDDLELIPLFNS